MPIPAPDQLNFEILMNGVIAGGAGGNTLTSFVFTFRRTTVVIAPNKSSINTAFGAAIAANIAIALSVDWTGTVYRIRCLDDALDPYQDFTSTDVGAVSGDRLASDQAAYLLLRTNQRGQSYRGSKHLGPFSESNVTHPDEDLWNAAQMTQLNVICGNILAGFTDADGNVWIPTVVSRKKSILSENPTLVIAADVNAVLASKRIGSMNRRKVKSQY